MRASHAPAAGTNPLDTALWQEEILRYDSPSRGEFSRAQLAAYGRFSEAVSSARAADGKLPPYRLLDALGPHLAAQGVAAHRREVGGNEVLALDWERPGRSAPHLLNRIAAGLHAQHAGLLLIYDPRHVGSPEVEACYLPSPHAIALSNYHMLNVHNRRCEALDSLAHEAHHSLTMVDLIRRKPSPYYGSISCTQPMSASIEGYELRFSFDEMKTHAVDLVQWERRVETSRSRGMEALAKWQRECLIAWGKRGAGFSEHSIGVVKQLLPETPYSRADAAWRFEHRSIPADRPPLLFAKAEFDYGHKRHALELPLVDVPVESELGRGLISRGTVIGLDYRAPGGASVASQLRALGEAARDHRTGFYESLVAHGAEL